MYQMYKITDEASLEFTIKDYIRFYSEEKPQDRYYCKTPLEVRNEALSSATPPEYLRRLTDDMPPYAKDYFRAVEQKNSAKTRISYVYNLQVFFHFLMEKKPVLSGKNAGNYLGRH